MVISKRVSEGGEGKGASLIASGQIGGFVAAAEPHRRELLVHCYQMLGSVHDAQDLVQETMDRAWRAYDLYDPELASMRTWLYRIATNACLNALQARARRPLPSGVGQPFEDPDAAFVPGFEVSWLQPFPDRLFGGPPQDPEMLAIERNRLRLALVGALQLLSAKQRAVLILRDVLDFSAAETAEALDISIAAANSALQRARVALRDHTVGPDSMSEAYEAREALVDRYAAAFERADVDALTSLLAEEVVLEMPPMWSWYMGSVAYKRSCVACSPGAAPVGGHCGPPPTASRPSPPTHTTATPTRYTRSKSSPRPPATSAVRPCSRTTTCSRSSSSQRRSTDPAGGRSSPFGWAR